MSIQEKYSRSVMGGQLKDDRYNQATNNLISIALSKVKIASQLLRVRYCNDATTYYELLDSVILITQAKALHHKWPIHAVPRSVSKMALDYWINPICTKCKGRGFDPKINMRGGFESECYPCGSTGKRDLQVDIRLYNYVIEIVHVLDDMELQAVRTAKR